MLTDDLTSRIVSTLQSAFADDPLYRWLYPDPVERHAALEATFALMLGLASDRGEVAVTGDGTAVALWTPPGMELLDDPAEFVRILDRWAPHRREDALAAMSRCSSHQLADAWVLHLVGVDATAQGQGLGVVVLDPLLHHADTAGTTICLDSSNPRNLGFYQRIGFEVVGEIPVASDGPVMRPMHRLPRPVG